MNFGEQIWCALSEEMSFETFTTIWSHVSEKEKYLAKIQNFKFHNSLKNNVRTVVWVGTSLHTLGVMFQWASTIDTGRRSD